MISAVKTIETRSVREGLTRRRYLLADGRRLTTYEVPATVLREFSYLKVTKALEKWQRGEASRARVRLMEIRVAEGVKPAAIAHEVGVTEARVRQVRDKMRKAAGAAR
jgi:hypothetical protein